MNAVIHPGKLKGTVEIPSSKSYAHRLLIAEDGTKYVQYTAHTLESKMWVLQYWLDGDRVEKIVHFYQP